MLQVVLEQAQAHRLQRLGDRGDLGEDVDAVRVRLHHPRDTAYLTLYAAKSCQVGVLVGVVPVRAGRLSVGNRGLLRGWALDARVDGHDDSSPLLLNRIPP